MNDDKDIENLGEFGEDVLALWARCGDNVNVLAREILFAENWGVLASRLCAMFGRGARIVRGRDARRIIMGEEELRRRVIGTRTWYCTSSGNDISALAEVDADMLANIETAMELYVLAEYALRDFSLWEARPQAAEKRKVEYSPSYIRATEYEKIVRGGIHELGNLRVIRKAAEDAGWDSLVAAYASGVPIEDLMA